MDPMNRRYYLRGLGLSALGGMTAHGAKQKQSKQIPAKANATSVSRLNIVFHGVFVYWVNKGGTISVHAAASDAGRGPVHQYKLKWIESGAKEYSYPSASAFDWKGIAVTGDLPSLSADEHVIVPNVTLNRRKVHASFELPYPSSIWTFRYSVGGVKVFKKVPAGVRNPSRLAFPVVFSYVNPPIGVKIPVGGNEISIADSNRSSVNLHVHADPPPSEMNCKTSMDHLFINNEVLQRNGSNLDFEYADLKNMRSTSSYESGSLIGLDAEDLYESCDPMKISMKPRGQKTLTVSDPPDACLGMWVFE